MMQLRKVRRAGDRVSLSTLRALSLVATSLTAFTAAAEAGEWQVLTVNGTPAEGEPTWAFNDDGTLGGSTGCNRFTAAGQFESGWLVIDGPVATTQRACAGDAVTRQEAQILSVFENGLAITYDPFAETLKLTGRTATILLVPLSAEPPQDEDSAAPERATPPEPSVGAGAPEEGNAAAAEQTEAEAPTIFNTAYVAVYGLSGRLNVRAEASTSAKIVGGVRAGALLANKGCEERAARTWCHVAHIGNGRPQGWVAADYVKPAPAALRAGKTLFYGIGTLACTQAGSDTAATCDYGVAHDPDGTAAVMVFLADGTESLVVFRDGALVSVDEAKARDDLQPSVQGTTGHTLVGIGDVLVEFPTGVITPN